MSIGVYEFTMLFVALPLAIVAFAFWIWMLVDCLVHEPGDSNEKIVWTIVIVFLQVIGAILYFLLRRRRRLAAAS